MVAAGLQKSWQKAPSCRLEIMLIGAGLGVLGKNGEFQEKCQFGGFYMVFTIVKTDYRANLGNGDGISV